MEGFLISFEGSDKSGKSSVITKLGIFLFDEFGIRAVPFREPGGTSIGEKIRNILHDHENTEMSAKTELFLYLASRSQLVEQRIKSELEKGSLVIIDRFGDSSKVYQGVGRELGIDKVDELNKYATGDLVPNLTVLLDVDLEIAEERSKNDGVEINRMDIQKADFKKRVREAYLQLAKSDPYRWEVVNTSGKNINDVFSEVRTIVVRKLYQEGFIETENKGKER